MVANFFTDWQLSKDPEEMLWMLEKAGKAQGQDKALRLFACWCAESCNQTDPCSIEAIAVAKRFATGEATSEELFAAQREAGVAWYELLRQPYWRPQHPAECARRRTAYNCTRVNALASAQESASSASCVVAYSVWREGDSWGVWVAEQNKDKPIKADALRTFLPNPFTKEA